MRVPSLPPEQQGQLDLGNSAALRVEFEDLKNQAGAAIQLVIEKGQQELAQTQDRVQIEFNKSHDRMNKIVDEAGLRFKQQESDIVEAYKRALEGERRLREQLGEKFEEQRR